MKDLIKKKMEVFINEEKAFTSLDISNSVKEDGNQTRHREISSLVKEIFKDDFDDLYDRAIIDVNAEIIDDDGTLSEINTKAILYHPFNFDISQYKSRSLRSIHNNENKDKEDSDIKNDSDSNLSTYVEYYNMYGSKKPFESEDFTSFEIPYQKSECNILISKAKWSTRNFDECKFNLLLYPDLIILKEHKTGPMKLSSENKLRVKKSFIDLVNLRKYDTAWVHIYDHQIKINNLHHIVMTWEKYKDKLVTFKVSTPQSDSGETEQTVVLRVDGFKKSKDGNYLVFGRNLKRLDDKNSIDDTVRQYRFDRIHKKTVEELNL